MSAAAVSPFWCNWLVAVATAIGLFSVIFLAAPPTGQRLFDAVYYLSLEGPALDEGAARYVQFANGVLGAMMIGWMTLTAIVANGPFRRGEAWAWTAIAASIGIWYVVDTTFSTAHGITGNVILNTIVAVAFGLPLAMTRRSFS